MKAIKHAYKCRNIKPNNTSKLAIPATSIEPTYPTNPSQNAPPLNPAPNPPIPPHRNQRHRKPTRPIKSRSPRYTRCSHRYNNVSASFPHNTVSRQFPLLTPKPPPTQPYFPKLQLHSNRGSSLLSLSLATVYLLVAFQPRAARHRFLLVSVPFRALGTGLYLRYGAEWRGVAIWEAVMGVANLIAVGMERAM